MSYGLLPEVIVSINFTLKMGMRCTAGHPTVKTRGKREKSRRNNYFAKTEVSTDLPCHENS